MVKNKILSLSNPEIILDGKPPEHAIDQIRKSVQNFNRLQTQGEYDEPGIEICVALKNEVGNVIGGVIASTVFKVMHLEVLWVAESTRKRGYGSRLVRAAEHIGFANGCLASQTWTFSFQGPAFYPAIGYEQIGRYEGYPDGITEHAFIKRFPAGLSPATPLEEPDSSGYFLTTDVTDEDKKKMHEGLHQHSVQHIGDKYRGIPIHLSATTNSGQLIGGLHAWTTLQNVIFERIWVEEEFRGNGIGRRLMQEMEKIAHAQGCIASQAYCFSFHAAGFFKKMGYQTIGLSDGYPQSVTESYLMKIYDRN